MSINEERDEMVRGIVNALDGKDWGRARDLAGQICPGRGELGVNELPRGRHDQGIVIMEERPRGEWVVRDVIVVA